MDVKSRILKLAQSIYLAENARYNDVESDEETEFVLETIDWVNQWLDEVELETDWNYVRRNRAEIGTIVEGQDFIELPPEVRTLVVNQYRDLVVVQDGAVVARFEVVSPNQLTAPVSEGIVEDRATLIGRKVFFSRDISAEESNGTVLADVIDYIPRLSIDPVEENADALDLITPRQLMVLGVAKNATLPDIVQGGTSPSHAQKYNDLLMKAVAENERTSQVYLIDRESFSHIGGVW